MSISSFITSFARPCFTACTRHASVTHSNRLFSTSKPSDLGLKLKQVAVMRFLGYPTLTMRAASVLNKMIASKGLSEKAALKMIEPFTSCFSVGTNAQEAVKKAYSLYEERGTKLLLDYVEEDKKCPKERQAVLSELLSLLEEISQTPLRCIPIKLTALIDPVVLEKISQELPLTGSEQQMLERERQGLYDLVESAYKKNRTLFIDQEYPSQKKAVFDIGMGLMQRYNLLHPTIFMTVQAADRDCFSLLRQLTDSKNCFIPGVKLVNGAYVDWALMNGYEASVQPSKMASLTSYLIIAKYCIRHQIPLFMGTHNLILEELIEDFSKSIQISRDSYEMGQLFGFTTKIDVENAYAIYGPEDSCAAYFLRRMKEGAGSSSSLNAPLMSYEETLALAESAALKETISLKEWELLCRAVRLDTLKLRQQVVQKELAELARQLWKPNASNIQ